MTDKRAIHTKLVALIASNPEAEALIKLNEIDADRRKNWEKLKLQYEGSEMHAIKLKETEKLFTTWYTKARNPSKCIRPSLSRN